MAFHHAITDPPGETGSYCVFILLNPRGKGLEFRQGTAFYLGQPSIKEFSRAGAQHPRKLLHQIISQIDLWVELAKGGHGLLLLGTQFFWAMKKKEGSLPWSRQNRMLGGGVWRSLATPKLEASNDVVMHTCIRPSVALRSQFSIDLGDVVASLRPELPHRGQVGVESTRIGAACARRRIR